MSFAPGTRVKVVNEEDVNLNNQEGTVIDEFPEDEYWDYRVLMEGSGYLVGPHGFTHDELIEVDTVNAEANYYFRIGETFIGPRRLTLVKAQETLDGFKAIRPDARLIVEVM